MRLILKENEKPALPFTHMICDTGLAEKLNKYELLKHLNQHSCNLLIGAPRSGKTSLITSLFSSRDCLRKVFHKVYLFQPSASASSIKNDIFDAIPDDQRYDELNIESLSDVYEQIKSLPKNQNKCIILDDMAAYLKMGELQALFKDLCNNRRHYGVSIYFLTQTYYSVPRELRKVFRNLFVFKVSKMELQTIFEEQIELSKDLVLPISRLVFNKRYNFLFINTETQTLFKNFDRIIIDEEN